MITPDDEAMEAASRWVAVLKRGPPSGRDRRALKAWLDQDGKHAAALDLMMNVWEQIEPLKPRGVAPSPAVTAPARPIRGAMKPAWVWAPAVGGALACTAVAAVILTAPTSQTYTTAVGEMRRISLSDHSTIWLNTGSRLKIRYTRLRRTLDLESGEGEFKVAHEAWRPFLVSTPDAVVRATGTDFLVRSDTGASRVVLVQGTVQVRSHQEDGGASVVMNAGESLLVPHVGPFKLTKADPVSDLAWRRGQLVFYACPLAEAVVEFARYSGVRVRFADEAAKHVQISGAFRATDFTAFLRDVSQIDGVRVHTDDQGEVVVRSRG